MVLGEKRQKSGSGCIIREETAKISKRIVVGIDAGSTETRVCIADKNDVDLFSQTDRAREILENISTTYIIPSTYGTIGNTRDVTPVSANLEDNYDSTIVLVKNDAENPLIGRERVLRGRKIMDASGIVPRYLDSSTNKTDNVIFYMNIIDSIGYAVMQKYNGSIPETFSIHLVLSVRPKELTSICKAKMISNLHGTYMFNWKSISLTLNIDDIAFTTEPEAQTFGTTTIYDLRAGCGIDSESYTALADKLANSPCYIHIEGGGSSIGVEVIRNGDPVDSFSSTFQLGGNYLVQMLIDRIRELRGRTITRDAAMNAIKTSKLRDGKDMIDVTDVLADCKNQVAMDIVERLRHEVLDISSEFSINDVEFISLGGRLFYRDGANNSIGEYISEYIHQLSPNTDTIILPENFIPQGNLVIGVNDEDFGETDTVAAEAADNMSTVSASTSFDKDDDMQ